MHKLAIGIIDLVEEAPKKAFWSRVMSPNFAGIMPQVIATWCEEAGHKVSLVCYTGREDLVEELPEKVDVVFISSFTRAAHLAYALSNLFRSRGAITVIGGPHARCYPDDAKKYFDYVLGFTDKKLIIEVLQGCSQHRPIGMCLSAAQHPTNLPSVRERWKFMEPTLRKAPFIKIIPLINGLGCPYSCEFCIDSSTPYQPLDLEDMKQDLQFLLGKFKRPHIGWHDPSFGVRFDDCMDAIEDAVPPNRIDFIAETTLSLLTESKLKRLKKNGFKALLPGIESWYDLGYKSRTAKIIGMEKVRLISEHVNMILRYVPYVQTNLIFGLDIDSGPEPFDLTKEFLDRTPGAFPAYSLMSAFGQAAPLNLEFQRANRVLPFPFNFLDNNRAMNVRPLNYSWPVFYDNLIDVTQHSFSPRMVYRRFVANRERIPRLLNIVRALSSEGLGRVRYFKEVRQQLDTNLQFRRFFEQETTEVPEFFLKRIQNAMGPFWEWLPKGALLHNPNAYLESVAKDLTPVAKTA